MNYRHYRRHSWQPPVFDPVLDIRHSRIRAATAQASSNELPSDRRSNCNRVSRRVNSISRVTPRVSFPRSRHLHLHSSSPSFSSLPLFSPDAFDANPYDSSFYDSIVRLNLFVHRTTMEPGKREDDVETTRDPWSSGKRAELYVIFGFSLFHARPSPFHPRSTLSPVSSDVFNLPRRIKFLRHGSTRWNKRVLRGFVRLTFHVGENGGTRFEK